MTLENITIEWAGYTASGTHLDMAVYRATSAAELVQALANGAAALRAVAAGHEMFGLAELATEATASAEVLAQLADAMRAEG